MEKKDLLIRIELIEQRVAQLEIDKPISLSFPQSIVTSPIPCMHDNCSECGGTGIKHNGLGPCVHFISCPCPKCTPTC